MPAGEAPAPGRPAEVRAEAGRGGQVQGDLCKIPDAWGCLNIGERSTRSGAPASEEVGGGGIRSKRGKIEARRRHLNKRS